jgi:hypothetical protein
LKDRHINDLLDLVMRDVGKVIKNDDDSKRKRDFQLKWTALDLKQRRHLEVAARLMAIAQRKYLAQAELTLMGDNVEEGLMKDLMAREEGSDEWVLPKSRGEDRCPSDAFVESPFMRYVAQKLCPYNSSEDQNDDSGGPELDSVTDYPILKRLRDKATNPTDSQIGYLSVVCACAEIFPAGECWTSTIGIASWHHLLPPSDSSKEDGVVYYHGSSPDDLGLLVSILAEMLEANGGPGGDLSLQSWILATLIRLTDSFAAQFLNFENNAAAFEPVGSTWRRVWRAVFRSDLRYHAYTEASSTSSLGDLVLTLLTKMINLKCTDPLMSIPGPLPTKRSSFIYENQHQIWALPVFKDCRAISSVAPLMLICSVLAVAGLSDAGSDKIDASLGKTLFPEDQTSSIGRRKRLLCLTLGCLKQWAPFHSVTEDGTKSEQYSFPAMVVVALVNGTAAIRVNEILALWSKVSDGTRLQCTTLPFWEDSNVSMEADEIGAPAYHEASLRCLWAPRRDQDHYAVIEEYRRHLDVPWVAAARIREQIASLNRSSESADFVPDSESDELRNATFVFFEQHIAFSESDNEGTNAFATVSSSSSKERNDLLSLQTMAVKCKLSLNLFFSDQIRRDKVKVAVNETVKFLSEASSRLTNISDPSEFCQVASDLLRITEALVEISPFMKSSISSESLDETVEIYKTMLL